MNIYYMVAKLYDTCINKRTLVEKVLARYPEVKPEAVYDMVEAIDAYYDLSFPNPETDNI